MPKRKKISVAKGELPLNHSRLSVSRGNKRFKFRASCCTNNKTNAFNIQDYLVSTAFARNSFYSHMVEEGCIEELLNSNEVKFTPSSPDPENLSKWLQRSSVKFAVRSEYYAKRNHSLLIKEDPPSQSLKPEANISIFDSEVFEFSHSKLSHDMNSFLVDAMLKSEKLMDNNKVYEALKEISQDEASRKQKAQVFFCGGPLLSLRTCPSLTADGYEVVALTTVANEVTWKHEPGMPSYIQFWKFSGSTEKPFLWFLLRVEGVGTLSDMCWCPYFHEKVMSETFNDSPILGYLAVTTDVGKILIFRIDKEIELPSDDNPPVVLSTPSFVLEHPLVPVGIAAEMLCGNDDSESDAVKEEEYDEMNASAANESILEASEIMETSAKKSMNKKSKAKPARPRRSTRKDVSYAEKEEEEEYDEMKQNSANESPTLEASEIMETASKKTKSKKKKSKANPARPRRSTQNDVSENYADKEEEEYDEMNASAANESTLEASEIMETSSKKTKSKKKKKSKTKPARPRRSTRKSTENQENEIAEPPTECEIEDDDDEVEEGLKEGTSNETIDVEMIEIDEAPFICIDWSTFSMCKDIVSVSSTGWIFLYDLTKGSEAVDALYDISWDSTPQSAKWVSSNTIAVGFASKTIIYYDVSTKERLFQDSTPRAAGTLVATQPISFQGAFSYDTVRGIPDVNQPQYSAGVYQVINKEERTGLVVPLPNKHIGHVFCLSVCEISGCIGTVGLDGRLLESINGRVTPRSVEEDFACFVYRPTLQLVQHRYDGKTTSDFDRSVAAFDQEPDEAGVISEPIISHDKVVESNWLEIRVGDSVLIDQEPGLSKMSSAYIDKVMFDRRMESLTRLEYSKLTPGLSVCGGEAGMVFIMPTSL